MSDSGNEISPISVPRDVLNEIARACFKYMVSVFWGNPDIESDMHSASGVLVRLDKPLLVTAEHVIRPFLERQMEERSLKLMVGKVAIDNVSERIIGRSTQPDLITLDLASIDSESVADHVVFYEPAKWPPKPAIQSGPCPVSTQCLVCGSGNSASPTAKGRSESSILWNGGWGEPRLGLHAFSRLGWNGCAQRYGRGANRSKGGYRPTAKPFRYSVRRSGAVSPYRNGSHDSSHHGRHRLGAPFVRQGSQFTHLGLPRRARDTPPARGFRHAAG
jgi:hypothetical protein